MGQLRLIDTMRTIGFKIESIPYSAETLGVTEYDFSAYDIVVTPEIETYARKLARGDFSQDTGVAGRRKFAVSFKVDLHPGNFTSVAPEYFKMLQACAMKQIIYGTTGIKLITDSAYGIVPATIEVVLPQEGTAAKQLVIKGKGCMGNAKLVLSQTGQPVSIQFEFQGALVSVTTRAFASMVSPTAFDTALPSAVLSATISLFGTTQCISTFTIDLGNDVQLFTCPSEASGYEGAHIVGRKPTLEIDPDALVTDDADWYTRHIDNTTGALSVTIGTNQTLYAPAANITSSYNFGNREGHAVNQLKLDLVRQYGNDEFYILQGAVS